MPKKEEKLEICERGKKNSLQHFECESEAFWH